MINPYAFGGASTDADAAAWAAAVTAAGGTYSAGTLAAVSAFCTSAKANGYWTKLNRINLFCGDQLTAALVPLKVGGGSSTDTNHSFVSGDYTEATGITGTGSAYLDTGLLASALTANDTHLSVYNRSSTAASGGAQIGADDNVNSIRFLAPFTDGNAYIDQYDGSNGRVSAAASTPFGFLIGSRTASNAQALYRNGTSLATSTTGITSVLPIGRTIFVFSRNNQGTPTNTVSQPLGAYSVGSGLTSTDASNFNTNMQTFQTALSRNV